ncbi:MAG: hypothetical protein MZV49_12625 [Rhodopseudomonas palustris]|nr:hypothetical protein [Rhodopseudomonas palustris]
MAPVGLGFEASNDFGLRRVHDRRDAPRTASAWTSATSCPGVEFGGTIDYLWGDYDPSFYTDSGGRRVQLVAGARARPRLRDAARQHPARDRSTSASTA